MYNPDRKSMSSLATGCYINDDFVESDILYKVSYLDTMCFTDGGYKFNLPKWLSRLNIFVSCVSFIFDTGEIDFYTRS